MRTSDALILITASALLAYALVGCCLRGVGVGVRVRASPVLTPGVLNAAVTQVTIASTICKRGWTATIRPPTSYTSALKLRQMAAYGEIGRPEEYQEDHLISLELG